MLEIFKVCAANLGGKLGVAVLCVYRVGILYAGNARDGVFPGLVNAVSDSADESQSGYNAAVFVISHGCSSVMCAVHTDNIYI